MVPHIQAELARIAYCAQRAIARVSPKHRPIAMVQMMGAKNQPTKGARMNGNTSPARAYLSLGIQEAVVVDKSVEFWSIVWVGVWVGEGKNIVVL